MLGLRSNLRGRHSITANDLNKYVSLVKEQENGGDVRRVLSSFAMSNLGVLLFPSDATSLYEGIINKERGFTTVVNAGLLDLQSKLRAAPVPLYVPPPHQDFKMVMVPPAVAALPSSSLGNGASCSGDSDPAVGEEAVADALAEKRRREAEKKARQRAKKKKERDAEARAGAALLVVEQPAPEEQARIDVEERECAIKREKARLKKEKQRKRKGVGKEDGNGLKRKRTHEPDEG
jgi:hypothetical protein